jgi:ABC-2 type transport system permease protein
MNKNAMADHQKRLMDLSIQTGTGKLKGDEYSKAVAAANDDYKRITDENEERFKDKAQNVGHLANLAIPPGWLALGTSGLADGKVLPALLATLGFTLIGLFSLSRAYRTTLRIYSGAATAKGQASAVKAPSVKPTGTLFVERSLPWVSEYASGIAVAGLRGLIRAPEIKMMMIGPVIMLVVFGGAFGSQIGKIPREAAPLIAFGAAAMTVLIMVQLTANQFGYDRTGFRAYVLGPVPRREILLGKNLAIAPFALGVALLALAIAGIVFPMRIDHYPAALLQVVSLYLVSCLLMNYMSIYCPIAVASGTMRPAHVHWGPVLMQMLIMMVYPLLTVPLLFPYGLELLLEQFDMPEGVPVSLLLSILILFVVVLIYRKMITGQGTLLHTREKKILEVVVSKEE